MRKPTLPKVKIVKRKRPHHNKWWRKFKGIKASEVVGVGLSKHRHKFEPEWTFRKKWHGNRFLVYEETICIYDGCGQLKVRHTKESYCDHCGSLKKY